MNKAKVRVIKNGPYLVTGGIPLSEKIITPNENGYEWTEGQKLPQSESYSLCRCGKSKNSPFCDGSHIKFEFNGKETASTWKYKKRATVIKGPEMDLYDDHRCAFARFCHREKGDVWELAAKSDISENKKEAMTGAAQCPAGRLVAVDKNASLTEPKFEPAIEIVQDPDRDISAGIIVKGNIPIESADGFTYEVRSSVMLCRCGRSRNKPFCDATHVPARFKDKE